MSMFAQPSKHIADRSSSASELSARSWWPLAVITCAHLMAILDITVMFVALPSAQHALGLSVAARQWVLTAYTLSFASLQLLGGRLADRFGARRTQGKGAFHARAGLGYQVGDCCSESRLDGRRIGYR